MYKNPNESFIFAWFLYRPQVVLQKINMLLHFMLMGLLAAGMTSSPLDLKNPCPEVFKYTTTTEKSEKAGAWQGTLTVVSDWKLHGMWLRLFFDKPVDDLKVLNSVADVIKLEEDNKTFLIKNRDLLLKKNSPIEVQFEINYNVKDAPPAFKGFRLNGRDICPAEIIL